MLRASDLQCLLLLKCYGLVVESADIRYTEDICN